MHVPVAGDFNTVPFEHAVPPDRPPASVLKILNGALQAVGERGAGRLSMSVIGQLAGVSRGTLYRYFKTKDDVLRAVGAYVSQAFENGVREAVAGIADPIERLHRVLRFHDEYSTLQEADKMLIVDPAFVVDFFHRHAPRHRAAILEALASSLDYFDRNRATPIDREAFADMLIRLQTSRIILRTNDQWPARWACFCAQVEEILRGSPLPA